MKTIFTNALLIDGTGNSSQPNSYVIVENDTIIAHGQGQPEGLDLDSSTHIDCAGKTIMPGLIDAHVHIGAFDANLSRLMNGYTPSYRVIRTLEVMESMLMQGFTSVRDCGGADIGFKQAQQEGHAKGPRLSICGSSLSQTGGHADFRQSTERYAQVEAVGGLPSVLADGVDAVRYASREQLRRGAEFLKVMAAGGAASHTDALESSQYTPEELRAIVYEAQSAGTYVAAHCYSDRSVLNSLEAGIYTIEHGNLITQKGAEAIAAAGAYLVPTLATYFLAVELGAEMGMSANNIIKLTEARDKGLHGVKMAQEAGAKIGLGSDCLGPALSKMGRSLSLQASVLGNMETIVAATKTNAEMMGWDDHLGTIEIGKRADILVVAGDPSQDITLLEDYENKIKIIMQDGTLIKNTL